MANCDLDTTPDTDLIQNGAPDAIALVNGDAIDDTVSYEGEVPGYTEGAGGAPTDTAASGTAQSISRVPDGCDTDVNATDFTLVDATPGAANAAASCDATPPGDSAPSVESSDSGDRRHRRRARRQPPRQLQRAGDRRRRRVLARLQRHRRRALRLTLERHDQVLDPQQTLVSPALLLQGHPDLDAVHINAEFSDQVSDHDPPITRLDVR